MQPLRVGVIGLGRVGPQHCRVYSSLRRTLLAGVYDAQADVTRDVAARFATTAYPAIEGLLDHVDAVSLAPPTPLHFELAMQCLRRGIPILIEKPLAETVEQAEALVEAIQAAGVAAQVGHIERFNPAYTELKNVLEDKALL